MGYYCHVWAGAPEYAGLLVLHLLVLLNPCQNLASLSLFYRYYFGRFSSELAQLVPLPFSRGRFSDRLHNFSVTVPTCYKNVYVNSFFPHTARLRNSWPIECSPLTYDLNGFMPSLTYTFWLWVLSKEVSCMF